MTKKLYDAEGNEVEAFTPEELENEQAQAITEKETQLKTEYETKINDLTEQITKLSGKDQNFATLREAKEKLEGQIKTITEQHEKEITEIKTGNIIEHKTILVSKIAGTDPEFKKRIEYEVGLLNMPESTKEEIEAKVTKAYQNATGDLKGNIMNKVISSAGAGGGGTGGTNDAARLSELAAKMGVKPEEFTTYYNKAKEKGLIK